MSAIKKWSCYCYMNMYLYIYPYKLLWFRQISFLIADMPPQELLGNKFKNSLKMVIYNRNM